MMFTFWQLAAIILIFVWGGFVRSGIGFGGAALALPLLLLVSDQPLFFLPIIGIHLLVFTTVTTGGRLKKINWRFIKGAMSWLIVPKIVGVIGLLSLPNRWMVAFVYSVSMVYALSWMLQRAIVSHSAWVDRLLLLIGGYVSGASLVGAPLIAAVAIRQVPLDTYRDTLFVLWFMLVTIKLSAFVLAGVDLQWQWALALLLPAAAGHVIGLRFHDAMLNKNPAGMQRILGSGLLLVSLIGFWQLSTTAA